MRPNADAQDCFEPLNGTKNWVLRNSYIADPANDNNSIDIFPRNGDNTSGRIVGCEIPNDLIRLAIGSGTQSSDGEIEDLIIKDSKLHGTSIEGPDDGIIRSLEVRNCELYGPCNATTGRLPVFQGIFLGATANHFVAVNNEIREYQGNGIWCATVPKALIAHNEIYNNGQATNRSTQVRSGINYLGDDGRIIDNTVYDDQGTPTQTRGIEWGGDSVKIALNDVSGQPTEPLRNGGTNAMIIGNQGARTKATGLVTIPSGSLISPDIENVRGSGPNPQDNITLTFAEDPGNASVVWAETTGGDNAVRARVDAVPGKDLEIAYHVDYDYENTV
jgi:hypothetical protein